MSDFQRKRTQRKQTRRRRARLRIRKRIQGTAERPRLAVTKSNRFVYAQVIDDLAGHTLAAASSREADLAKAAEGAGNSKAAARLVGEAVAKRAKDKGVEMVVFDRGGYVYHGRIREIAEGAREAGLKL